MKDSNSRRTGQNTGRTIALIELQPDLVQPLSEHLSDIQTVFSVTSAARLPDHVRITQQRIDHAGRTLETV